MSRDLLSLIPAALFAAACSEDARIGLQITSHNNLVDSSGEDYATVVVWVSRDCFYAVTIGGVLRYSGRWAEGQEEVRFIRSMLGPCRNTVHIEVAAQNGSAASDEEEVWYCRNDCDEECGGEGEPDSGVLPEPDSGVGLDSGTVEDPRFEHLCDECVGYEGECGGPGDYCINYQGTSVCGADCSVDPTCPYGFDCYEVLDYYGDIIGRVCMPDPYLSPCVY